MKEQNKSIVRVGFGTPGLLGLNSERERQDLLAAALDAGITHFDTAPYYGYGEAEKILGRFIAGRRSQVTITTKFGITPPPLPGGGCFAGTVKKMVRQIGPLKRMLSRHAGKMVRRGAYTPDDARQSLEASLNALRTDHIDVFLLHEGGPENCTPELLAFLQEQKTRGVIGSFGLGSDFPRTLGAASQAPEFCRVLQFENSIVHPNRQRIANDAADLLITHGGLGKSFKDLDQVFSGDDSLRRQCSVALDADVTQPDVLAGAMLSWAAQDNQGGIVLVASRSVSRLRAAAAALQEPLFSLGQLENFAELVRRHLGASNGVAFSQS
jgi:D-threo-aldose 1-dehydrogenase